MHDKSRITIIHLWSSAFISLVMPLRAREQKSEEN